MFSLNCSICISLKKTKQKYECVLKVRDMQQLNGTRRDSERQPATMGEIERHAETPWNWKKQ